MYSVILIILAAVAVFLPIFSGYLVGALLLVWLLFEGRWRVAFLSWRNSLKWLEEGSWATHQRQQLLEISRVLKPVHLGILQYLGFLLLAGILSYFLSDYVISIADVGKKLFHQFLKQGLVWFVLSGAISIFVVRGFSINRLGQVWAVVLIIHLVYVLVQRYTGIDISHGFGAILPPNRYAYGVFRISGFMGHPLTLSYNLVLLSLTTFFFCYLYFSAGFRGTSSFTEYFKKPIFYWGVCLTLSIITLILTGSRWPILVVLASIFLVDIKRIWRFKLWWGVAVVVVVVGLYFEGSIISRAYELIDSNIPIEQRFSRIMFWKAHLNMFFDYPISGVGLAGSDYARPEYYAALNYHDKIYTAHNIFIQTLADSGLVGFFGLICLLRGFFKAAKLIEYQISRYGAYLLILASILSGLMQNVFRDSEFVFAFWLLFSITLIQSIREIKEPK